MRNSPPVIRTSSRDELSEMAFTVGFLLLISSDLFGARPYCSPITSIRRKPATVNRAKETGQSASATVEVSCYRLRVQKDATPSFNRCYEWTIAKSADQTELTLTPGQSFLVNYEIGVDATPVDKDWAVQGEIWVENPAPVAATINGVADLVAPNILPTVDCGVAFPCVLGPGVTLNCSYSTQCWRHECASQ